MKTAARTKPTMSDAQKKAMAEGRATSRSVARYLEALAASSPRRGRRRTKDSIQKRLRSIDATLPKATPITKLALVQERLDLQAELEALQNGPSIADYEKGFIAAAKEYSERKGISYTAWRELGVDPAVLRRAGITR